MRNSPDGAVEAHLSGEQSAVDELIERLHRGPPSAKVDQVETDEVEPEFTKRFEIRH